MAGARQEWAASGSQYLPNGLIFPELVHSGFNETLQQNTDAFNTSSLGCIRLVTRRSKGDFAQSSFFKNVSNLINRRAVTGSPNNPDVAASNLPMGESVAVKLNRRIGPVDQTLDSFRKIGMGADPQVLSFLLGEQIAKAYAVDQLNHGLYGSVAALTNSSGTLTDRFGGSPTSTMRTNFLVDALADLGDAAGRVKLWVMHSKVWFDLVKEQIGLALTGVSDFNIATGTPITLGRPVLVTDSAALVSDPAESPTAALNRYTTLGLTEDAVVLEESEEAFLYDELITGKENIVARLQGETAYNLAIKGYRWDQSNGGVNPATATIQTGSNWDAVMDSVKSGAGVALYTR